MSDNVFRIAMWSGPRNLSTALMRSWGSRGDTIVCDEPFYAYWLAATGCNYHPGWEETLARHETDWRKVVEDLLAPLPQGKQVYYQKQMAHHLLPEIDRGWTQEVINCFLIRSPVEMLTSLVEFVPEPSIEDTGLPQQVEIFDETWQRTGKVPAVVDSHDIAARPREVLSQLCQRIGLAFDEAMLSWEPGLRETDGVWARWWYDKVAETTGFSEARPPKRPLPEHLKGLLERCQPLYERLFEHRLR
jgi:hypothetical protein